MPNENKRTRWVENVVMGGVWSVIFILTGTIVFLALWAKLNPSDPIGEMVVLIQKDQVCDSYNNILERETKEVARALVRRKYTPGETPVNEQTFSCLLGQSIIRNTRNSTI